MNRPVPPKIPGWLNTLLVAGALLGLLWWERKRPLRKKVEPKFRHDARNLVLATVANGTVRFVETPVVTPLCQFVERRRWGLLKRWRLPPWLEVLLAVMLMDYTLYLWHVLTHRVPFLWRFHQPHHVDLDLTASTALRFHFGELALATGWRAGQVLVIGVSPLSLSVWQTFTLLEIMFHHSNIDLPPQIERWLSRLLITPRLHGIHHSIVQDETNSNWSSGLTVWDWLHGTLRRDVPQEAITIGVPAFQQPEDLTLPRVMVMPFGTQPEPWQFSDGSPSRSRLSSPDRQDDAPARAGSESSARATNQSG